jgi:hypothetical protein
MVRINNDVESLTKVMARARKFRRCAGGDLRLVLGRGRAAGAGRINASSASVGVKAFSRGPEGDRGREARRRDTVVLIQMVTGAGLLPQPVRPVGEQD